MLLYFLLFLTARLPTSVDEILESYGNPSIRPGLVHEGQGVRQDVVSVNFGVDRLQNLDLERQVWGAFGYMRTWWQDSRLAFNESVLGPEVTLRLSQMNLIWQPDLCATLPSRVPFIMVGTQLTHNHLEENTHSSVPQLVCVTQILGEAATRHWCGG